jgi:hypothetical protein
MQAPARILARVASLRCYGYVRSLSGPARTVGYGPAGDSQPLRARPRRTAIHSSRGPALPLPSQKHSEGRRALGVATALDRQPRPQCRAYGAEVTSNVTASTSVSMSLRRLPLMPRVTAELPLLWGELPARPDSSARSAHRARVLEYTACVRRRVKSGGCWQPDISRASHPRRGSRVGALRLAGS